MNANICVAFYVARHGNKWDRVVAAATGSQFSHCELVFDESLGAFWHLPPDPEAGYREGLPSLDPVCFSASPRDNGTRFKRIDVWERGDDGTPKWKLIALPMIDAPAASRILAWCADQAGRRYDWPGVLSLGLASVTLATAEIPAWWFCSEVCFRALANHEWFVSLESPPRVTPQRLYDFCIAAAHIWNRTKDSRK